MEEFSSTAAEAKDLAVERVYVGLVQAFITVRIEGEVPSVWTTWYNIKQNDILSQMFARWMKIGIFLRICDLGSESFRRSPRTVTSTRS
jgi:hypothetical protein